MMANVIGKVKENSAGNTEVFGTIGMLLIFLCILLCSWTPLPAIATPPVATPPVAIVMAPSTDPSPESVLEQLFRSEPAQASQFAPSFLQQISIQQIQGLLSSLKQTMGTLQTLEPIADGYELTFDNGRVPAKIQLNRQGQIVLLFFGPPEGPISLDEAIQAIEDFPGEASLWIESGADVLVDIQGDHPLGVGSTFKLVVLSALQDAIAAGTHNWDDVVRLQPDWRSLPSGLLQDWPPETAITLESLATMMIAISDNTATDALINVVGRDALEALTPRNSPFLTTREFFALKNPANGDLLTAFRQADGETKKQVLAALKNAALPSVDVFSGDPVNIDIEWQLSTRELCTFMAQVQSLPLMSVNPGVAKPKNWQRVAYKGGSEPGVLNLTTGLRSKNGKPYCVSATWNDPNRALDEIALTRLYSGLIEGLSQ